MNHRQPSPRRVAALIAIPVCGVLVPYLAEWVVSQDARAVAFEFGRTALRRSWMVFGLGLLPYACALIFAGMYSGIDGDTPGKASPPFVLAWVCTFIPVLVLHFLFCRFFILDEFDGIRQPGTSTAVIAFFLVPVYLVGITIAGWVLAMIGGLVIYLVRGQKKSDLEPLCTNCQYSLRGIDSRRCPECGYDTIPVAEPSKHDA